MPFMYDLARAVTSNGSAGTASTHLWGATVANQDACAIYAFYAASRFGTAGGGQFRLNHNTGTTASGGTTQTASPKNLRGSPAAQSVWKNDATAITAGGTLVQRQSVGFAQTGGTGGWAALIPQDAYAMMPNATNPVDVEFTSVASSASVTFDLTVSIGEGI